MNLKRISDIVNPLGCHCPCASRVVHGPYQAKINMMFLASVMHIIMYHGERVFHGGLFVIPPGNFPFFIYLLNNFIIYFKRLLNISLSNETIWIINGWWALYNFNIKAKYFLIYFGTLMSNSMSMLETNQPAFGFLSKRNMTFQIPELFNHLKFLFCHEIDNNNIE